MSDVPDDLRAKAVRILRAAAASSEASAQNLSKIAALIGLDVAYDPEADDGTGPDMDAVELAAVAWLRVDPEPHGIESPHDPRRDAVAADQLERGWNPGGWP